MYLCKRFYIHWQMELFKRPYKELASIYSWILFILFYSVIQVLIIQILLLEVVVIALLLLVQLVDVAINHAVTVVVVVVPVVVVVVSYLLVSLFLSSLFILGCCCRCCYRETFWYLHLGFTRLSPKQYQVKDLLCLHFWCWWSVIRVIP